MFRIVETSHTCFQDNTDNRESNFLVASAVIYCTNGAVGGVRGLLTFSAPLLQWTGQFNCH